MMKFTTPYRSQLFQALIIFLSLALSLPVQAGVTARLSSPQTSLDQPVTLSLESEGEVEQNPDLSVLEKDFEILGRATQQSISFINGQMSSKRSLVLTLLPKHTGSLVIPPIPFGKQATEALSLAVAEQPADRPTGGNEARVELSLNKTRAYPEEEVVLTLKLYQAAGVQGERLDEPQPSLRDTQLQLLDESQYSTQQDGVLYRVLERNYALFAYQSGKLEIGPLEFRGRTGGSSIFSLLDDPFTRPRQASHIIRAASNRVSLEIAPIPAAFTGDRWLPARNLQLVQTGLDENGPVLAGKPLTRRIMLLADGLMSSQLPSVNETLPDGLKPYEERPQLKDSPRRTGISSSRQSATTLMPTKAGHYTLPPIELPWWNTETDRQEVARLPAVELEVMPNPAVATAADIQLPNTQADQQSTTPKELAGQANSPTPANSADQDIHWLVWLLAAIWLLTLLGWWLSHRRRTESAQMPLPVVQPPLLSQNRQAQQALIDEMKAAYARSDSTAAREVWLKWAQLKWPQNPPNNLTRLAKRLPPQLAQAVIDLEKALYSPGLERKWSTFDPDLIYRLEEDEIVTSAQEARLLPLNP